ncbi:hypothetical protein [Caulobacter vibrioides]|nr:hypothetical protein [Caulobacter vibrioides]
MIDAEMSFAHVASAGPPRKRFAPLVGLGLAAGLSSGLWALLVFGVMRLI